MKTYKQQLRELGVSWPHNSTKGQLKSLIKEWYKLRADAWVDLRFIELKTGKGLEEISKLDMQLDDIKKFVNWKNRLPTVGERQEMRKFPNFKYWFNYAAGGRGNDNNVWTYPSPIYNLYNSL